VKVSKLLLQPCKKRMGEKLLCHGDVARRARYEITGVILSYMNVDVLPLGIFFIC